MHHSDKLSNKIIEKNRLGEKSVAKLALSEQVQAISKLGKLRESRALLDNLK